ncbi:MAG: Transcriptional regulator, PadR family, partial [uncultured Thermomicrobiales bacterium]
VRHATHDPGRPALDAAGPRVQHPPRDGKLARRGVGQRRLRLDLLRPEQAGRRGTDRRQRDRPGREAPRAHHLRDHQRGRGRVPTPPARVLVGVQAADRSLHGRGIVDGPAAARRIARRAAPSRRPGAPGGREPAGHAGPAGRERLQAAPCRRDPAARRGADRGGGALGGRSDRQGRARRPPL